MDKASEVIVARESGRAKKIISVEAGGRLKHCHIPSRNIFQDLKKNLVRFGVLEEIQWKKAAIPLFFLSLLFSRIFGRSGG